ncbi:hypothetical protein M3Y97_00835100 [Aphelenchoides bicaudatus]|nr:hypothetical protein M3Y97_00835100 [Aphelenchoides bicaudatus]
MRVIECSKLGHKAVGIELNYPLVLYSRYSALRSGVSSNTRFLHKNIFKQDMSEFNTVVLFAAENMVEFFMPKLDELQANSNLILCRFPLPDNQKTFKLIEQVDEGIDTAWLYKRIDNK